MNWVTVRYQNTACTIRTFRFNHAPRFITILWAVCLNKVVAIQRAVVQEMCLEGEPTLYRWLVGCSIVQCTRILNVLATALSVCWTSPVNSRLLRLTNNFSQTHTCKLIFTLILTNSHSQLTLFTCELFVWTYSYLNCHNTYILHISNVTNMLHISNVTNILHILTMHCIITHTYTIMYPLKALLASVLQLHLCLPSLQAFSVQTVSTLVTFASV